MGIAVYQYYTYWESDDTDKANYLQFQILSRKFQVIVRILMAFNLYLHSIREPFAIFSYDLTLTASLRTSSKHSRLNFVPKHSLAGFSHVRMPRAASIRWNCVSTTRRHMIIVSHARFQVVSTHHSTHNRHLASIWLSSILSLPSASKFGHGANIIMLYL